MSKDKDLRNHNVRDIKIALVCYGGVSLAIYMHGVTKELNKLIIASREFEKNSAENPFGNDQVEHTYWNVFKHIENKSQGVRLRFIIDIVSGTSAGGINGVFLAKALSHKLSLQSLRDMWLDKGDIKKLLRGPDSKYSWLNKILLIGKIAVFAGSLILKRLNPLPPLDADKMFKWIYKALKDMDASAKGDSSLVPDGQSLELYVTVTDFYGYTRHIPIKDPGRISDLRHRHVLKFLFNKNGKKDQFTHLYNPALTFSARGTSSFPGAFSPINIENISKNIGKEWSKNPIKEDFISEFFRIYQLSGCNVEENYFVDGGVLDNFPFDHAVKAILNKHSSTEVTRYLMYIEPDPKEDALQEDRDKPTWLGTIWGGLSTIPSNEPILDDLLKIKNYNSQVHEINIIINNTAPQVHKELNEIVKSLNNNLETPLDSNMTTEYMSKVRGIIHEKAGEFSKSSYPAYVNAKMLSVVEQFAIAVSNICNYPIDSNFYAFVREVIFKWAESNKLIVNADKNVSNDTLSEDQILFLESFDFKYSLRRLRFIMNTVNGMYKVLENGKETKIKREDLNKLKGIMSENISTLQLIIQGDSIGGDILKQVKDIFCEDSIRQFVLSNSKGDDKEEFHNYQAAVSRFAESKAGDINNVKKALQTHFKNMRKKRANDLYREIHDCVKDWEIEDKSKILVSFLGFPLFDIVIFPILFIAGTSEELEQINVVRMSPNDVNLLSPRGAKDKLRGVKAGHFSAFFKREYRENDYLWGRLDGAERFISLILGQENSKSFCKEAFSAILNEEEPDLLEIKSLFENLKKQVQEI